MMVSDICSDRPFFSSPLLACLLYVVKRHPNDSPITALYGAALRWPGRGACDAGFCLRSTNKTYGRYLDSTPE
jgi:hypothetical protein